MTTINGIGTTLYGRSKKQALAGIDRSVAEQAGFDPVSYQAVKWFVVLFLPVIPLGTYRVIRYTRSNQYSMQEIEWDWRQVGAHYAVTYLPIAGLAFVAEYLSLLA